MRRIITFNNMSTENYIASAVSAVVEAAKQILAAHTGADVDVDDLFDVDASATADTSEGEGGVEVAGESAIAKFFDVDIPNPEDAVEDKIAHDVPRKVAQADYAQNLFDQIGAIQENLIEYEAVNHPNEALQGKIDELQTALSLLEGDINGGSTDMKALWDYYNRLIAIQADGMKPT